MRLNHHVLLFVVTSSINTELAEQFYHTPDMEETASPERYLRPYFESANFRELLPAIKRRVPECSDSLRKQWAAAFLALIDVPHDLRGARNARWVLQYLARDFLHKMRPIPELPYRVLDALLRGIDEFPDTQLTEAKVAQETAQLFTVHLKAFEGGRKQRRRPTAAYTLWMPSFHEGLRVIQRTTPKDGTVKWYMTSVRMFFQYLHYNTRRRSIAEPSRSLLEQHLDASFRQYQNAPQRLPNASHTAENHKANILRIFSLHKIHQRNARQGMTARRETLKQCIRERVPFEDVPTHLLDRIHMVEPSVIREVEYLVEPEHEDAPDELNDPELRVSERIYITHSQNRVVSYPPHRQRHRLNPYLLAAFPWWWDCRASVNLHDLRMLYSYIYYLMQRDAIRYSGLALFALFTLFTGRTLRDLVRLQFAAYPDTSNGEEPPRDGFFFDADRYWFFYFQHRGRSSFTGDPSQGWLSSTPWVAFPVPNAIRLLLTPYLSRLRQWGISTSKGDVLRNVTSKGDLRPLTPKRFDRMAERDYQASALAGFLRPLPLCGLSEAEFSAIVDQRPIEPPKQGTFLKSVPLAHIAKAFPALIGHGGGLDDVAIRLISGRGSFRAYSQLHYTHLIPRTLFSDYQAACTTLHQKILDGLPRGIGRWWRRQGVSTTHTLPAKSFGSPLVRQDDALRRLVERLLYIITRTGAVRSLTDVVTHHNAYTCYTYLLLLHMGVRPQRNPTVSQENENAPWDRLIITDKRSAMYLEQRLLSLPPPGPAILTQLSQGKDRLRRALWAYGGTAPARKLDMTPDGQLASLFVFLDRNGEIITFSLVAFREQLRRFQIDLPRTTPTNWGRHWIRTRLYADGLADDAINLWLGHVRAGREPLAHHSCTSYGSALQRVSERVGHHLAVIGFRRVQYFPGG